MSIKNRTIPKTQSRVVPRMKMIQKMRYHRRYREGRLILHSDLQVQ